MKNEKMKQMALNWLPNRIRRWLKGECYLLSDRKQFDGCELMPCDYGYGHVMLLNGSWQPKFHKIIQSKKIRSLRLSQSAGWQDEDLSFLSELKQLRNIEIYSWKVKDISPIQHLKELTHLSLKCEFRKPIDFSAFSNLNCCFIMWRPKCDSLFDCKSLIELNMERYPYHDLSSLHALDKLEILKLTSRKLESLNGIERLKQLRFLDLFECTQLTGLEGLEALDLLETIEIETCKKISHIKPVGFVRKLRRFDLTQCG
ncbi:MAG: hypothetical protein GY816_21180, partial [Cytophagales bacterium]|nr:hypothetical protein [Cytophagales bacterium]